MNLKKIIHAPLSMPQVYDFVQRLFGSAKIASRLQARLSETDGWVVLDVGAGTGLYMSLFPPDARYIWLDLDRQKKKGFRIRSSTAMGVMSDGTRIALADKSVDYVLCAALSHHIPDARFPFLFQELARVARKKLIFLDAVKSSNPIGNLLWALDQGSFPRPEQFLRSAMETCFLLENVEAFQIYHHYILCVGSPKR